MRAPPSQPSSFLRHSERDYSAAISVNLGDINRQRPYPATAQGQAVPCRAAPRRALRFASAWRGQSPAEPRAGRYATPRHAAARCSPGRAFAFLDIGRPLRGACSVDTARVKQQRSALARAIMARPANLIMILNWW